MNKVKLNIKTPTDKVHIWVDKEVFRINEAYTKLRDICFWNKWDFASCIKFIENEGVSWMDVSETMVSGMSIAEACDIVKIKQLNK